MSTATRVVVSPADLRAARRVLHLPTTDVASVRRTSSTSSLAYASYRTSEGDQVTNMPRGAADFRSACAHLGITSTNVRRLTFHGTMCTAHTDTGRIDVFVRRVPPARWWERLADMIWREEV